MEPEVVASVIIASMTVALSLLGLVWQVGRWQAKAEARSTAFCLRLSAQTKSVDTLVARYDSSIADAHNRIDRHIDRHVDLPVDNSKQS